MVHFASWKLKLTCILRVTVWITLGLVAAFLLSWHTQDWQVKKASHSMFCMLCWKNYFNKYFEGW